MVVGKKFWPLGTHATDTSYNPGDYPGVTFGGVINATTSITNVDAGVVTAIAALVASTAGNVGIAGQWIASGTRITAASGTTLTLSQPSLGSVGLSASLVYWNLGFPSAAGGDAPINALFCNVSSALAFYDASGKLVSFAAGKLVVGAVYYFEILKVKTSTAGDYVGYSAK